MYAKKITYDGYNGDTFTETFYFNLTEAEIAEMELEVPGGLTALIEKIVAAKDLPSLTKAFKDILFRSYGVKSPDGKRFIKNQEVLDEFTQSDAYNKLFMELLTDDRAGSEFVKGVIPNKYAEALAEEERKTGKTPLEMVQDKETVSTNLLFMPPATDR